MERWDFIEITLEGKREGNPFTDYTIEGRFRSKNEDKRVDGFYDGDGIYKVRFMPSFAEEYTYVVGGTFSGEKSAGSFSVTPATGNNRGPVRVAAGYHFAYEDGTPHYSLGTTCYVWTHQSRERQGETLDTLASSAFNKIRFCVFPKHYDYNFADPLTFPYEGTPCDNSGITKENFSEYGGRAPGNDWDFTRFNPEHFRRIEERLADLRDRGIEADLIMLHPYDRWGFSLMSPEEDDLYFRYIIARFSAFRNVWWSLANEFDLMKSKTLADWERLAGIICQRDPYSHLRSIHNCGAFYNHSRPWVTHCSIQKQDVYRIGDKVREWREMYRKPVVLDEISYEGNIQHGWGNISGREMTRRFWDSVCKGGYAGHGETYLGHDGVLWWSHGGRLHGESPARLLFLRKILDEVPGPGLKPWEKSRWDEGAACLDEFIPSNRFFLIYYGLNRPSFRHFYFDDSTPYRVQVIDTWEMTIEDRGSFTGKFTVDLPGKEYMALRIWK